MRLEIPTILKLAKLAVDKYSQANTQPGFKTQQNGVELRVRFSELSAALEELSKKDLVEVRRCKDCDNWSKSFKGKAGACFPKDYTCSRNSSDFCSHNYVYRSKEKEERDDTINRLSSEK